MPARIDPAQAVIFLCHRRDDAIGHAHRIADRLRSELGDGHVFIDLGSIPYGCDWKQVLDERLSQTCLLIAIIGRRWLAGDGPANRLLEETDFVRREIATALAARTPVLPVLVDGATLPEKEQLPADVQAILGVQALPVLIEGPYFDTGIEAILQTHRRVCRRRSPRRWFVGAAIALALGAAGLLAYLRWPPSGPARTARPNFVVQVFREAAVSPIGARVQVRSLLSNERQTQETDADGNARFVLQNAELVQLYVALHQEQPCRATLLPAFTPRELPAVNAVDVSTIRGPLWGACATSDAANVTGTTTGRSSTAAAIRTIARGNVKGDQSFLPFHMPWGVPQAETIVARSPYALGFNPETKIARWVGYQIQRGQPLRRRPSTYPFDPLLPVEQQARPDAYADNPYDRGNLVTRIDVSALGEQAEDEVFYMSVIAPQTDFLNQRVWTGIERLSSEAALNGRVWVLTGPAFVPQEGSNQVNFAVLPGGVAIPTHFFRIMVREGSAGLEALTFLVPNGFSLDRDVATYLTSIRRIEEVTGLQLFTELPPAQREPLVTQVASGLW